MTEADGRAGDPADPGRRRVLSAAAALATGSLVGACASSATSDKTKPASASVAWARGGTATIGGGYPDPFAAGASGSCSLTCARTLGPCYAKTLERKDVSEGRPGLPLRLSFLLVGPSCRPTEGAMVDVWHTSNKGLYSADDTARMCNGDDADARSHRFFRGLQRSDARGRVDFDTCFPGWYAGRAVHLHITVRIGADEYVTSQLFFPQSLVAEIYASHPDYAWRGQPDTPNDRDSLAGADAGLLLDVRKMPDGVMLGSKSIALRSALGEAICGYPDRGGPPGGSPPDGKPPPPPGARP